MQHLFRDDDATRALLHAHTIGLRNKGKASPAAALGGSRFNANPKVPEVVMGSGGAALAYDVGEALMASLLGECVGADNTTVRVLRERCSRVDGALWNVHAFGEDALVPSACLLAAKAHLTASDAAVAKQWSGNVLACETRTTRDRILLRPQRPMRPAPGQLTPAHAPTFEPCLLRELHVRKLPDDRVQCRAVIADFDALAPGRGHAGLSCEACGLPKQWRSAVADDASLRDPLRDAAVDAIGVAVRIRSAPSTPEQSIEAAAAAEPEVQHRALRILRDNGALNFTTWHEDGCPRCREAARGDAAGEGQQCGGCEDDGGGDARDAVAAGPAVPCILQLHVHLAAPKGNVPTHQLRVQASYYCYDERRQTFRPGPSAQRPVRVVRAMPSASKGSPAPPPASDLASAHAAIDGELYGDVLRVVAEMFDGELA